MHRNKDVNSRLLSRSFRSPIEKFKFGHCVVVLLGFTTCQVHFTYTELHVQYRNKIFHTRGDVGAVLKSNASWALHIKEGEGCFSLFSFL